GDEALTADELLESLTMVLEEELIESVMKVEDLEALSLSELREMEKTQPGILLFAFTTWGERHKGLEVNKLGNDYLPKVGDNFTVDFRGNEEAEWLIGAADLLPPEARGIKVGDRTSIRRVGLKGETRGGFYDEAGYIPVFTDDEITIHNVDVAIREAYFDEETGVWDYESYDEANAEEEAAYLVIPTGMESSGTKPVSRVQHGYSSSLEKIGEDHADWSEAAEAASETFSRKLGVDVPTSSVFAVIAKESNFNPVAVSSSGCTGLGQFGRGAWTDFIKANKPLARKLMRDQGLRLPVRDSKILELRTNPILNIYATTWYLGTLAKRMGYGQVDSSSIKEVYLAYHEGLGGKRTLERYIQTGRGNLHPWQKEDPHGYWKFVNSYAGQVEAQAVLYEGE
ncbi:MAG: hypothetical protein ACI9QC_000981, partial [Oceanicoccus sp.]